MERAVMASLMRINRHRIRFLKCAMAPYQYVGVMHLIVLYIGRNPGASQEEIANFYALDKTSVARDARRLEDLGHIERKIIPENRRQYQLFLTEAGQSIIHVLEETMDQFQRTLSSNISPEDWQQLTNLLKRLEENICLPKPET